MPVLYNKVGQRKFLTFPDLKSWVFVVSNTNMLRQEATEVHDMGSFQQVINSLSFGVYQAASMVAVTSISTLLHSYFQNAITVLKLEEYKDSRVLLLLVLLLYNSFLKTGLPNTPPL